MTARRIVFWGRAAFCAFLVASAAIFYMFVGDFDGDTGNARLEAAKLVLQFGLLTFGGGLLVAYLNKRRDDELRVATDRRSAEDRSAARRAALQELVVELGDAHRRLKIVKRQMRAQLLRSESDADGDMLPPFNLRVDAFERAMEALLNAQVAAEEVRDRIELRGDLLTKGQIVRVRKALRYGARYFHDVYQDYERCLVKRTECHYIISPACGNLVNFLTAKTEQLDKGHAKELEQLFRTMKNDDRTLDQRHDALEKIEDIRLSDTRRRRYRIVATECFSLAADEIRDAIRNELSMVSNDGVVVGL